MKEEVFISERTIIVDNNKFNNSDYSLYSLNGILLQKGITDVNGIPLNPSLENQTLVIVLMKHSSIFSKKLHFTH